MSVLNITAELIYMKSFTYAKSSNKHSEVVKTFNTINAVAAILIAFNNANNQIEKRDYCDETGNKIVSNRSFAIHLLEQPQLITEEDKSKAKEIIQYIQGVVTMGILSNRKISPFTLDLAKLLDEETVPEFKIGLLVYAANIYYQGKKREELDEQTLEVLYTSQPLGEEGDKVAVNFNCIEYRFVSQLSCFNAYGKDEKGNLVSFLTKKEELCKSQVLTGKIKKAGLDQWHKNACVTQLNYVKGIKD
jgi:hypothetical protein